MVGVIYEFWPIRGPQAQESVTQGGHRVLGSRFLFVKSTDLYMLNVCLLGQTKEVNARKQNL